MIIGRAERLAVGARDERRAPAARVVTRAGALDLYDVGAEIGEDLSRPRTCQNARKLKNADTGERSGHGYSPCFRRQCLRTRSGWQLRKFAMRRAAKPLSSRETVRPPPRRPQRRGRGPAEAQPSRPRAQSV